MLVLPEELSIADGTLTPSMKLRRRHLEQRYHKQIDAMYAEEHAPSRAEQLVEHAEGRDDTIPFARDSFDGFDRNRGFAMCPVGPLDQDGG